MQTTEAEVLRPRLRPQVLDGVEEVLAQIGLHLGVEVTRSPPENIEELAKHFEEHLRAPNGSTERREEVLT